ncbi:hypothetical protein MBLNU457_1466t1 [Dothideomycetes sp. NU457]
MVTYALLGATGSTGSAILRRLLSQTPENLTLNIFVRSRSKLISAFPQLEAQPPPTAINIYEGTPSDAPTLQKCLEQADVIMACIATNTSTPDVTVCHDVAAGIISALKARQQTQASHYAPPTVIQIRSASLNPALCATMPWIAKTMAQFCFHYVYEDLRRACELYESASSAELLRYIYVDPPSIHDPDGTDPTGYALVVEPEGPLTDVLSYADLGAAFVELAERRAEFVDMAVGVSATGKVNVTMDKLFPFIVTGFKSRIWG